MNTFESLLTATYRRARRVIILIIGLTVLIVGIIMLVLPGPAFVVIPLGLGILAVEFAWARIWLKKIQKKMSEVLQQKRSP